MVTYADDDLLQLSGIQHFAFCRRQWALIHIEQQWQENLLTYRGRELHERADDPFFAEARGTVVVTRAMPIISRQLGLYGVADVVEFYRDEAGVTIKGRTGFWRPHPVEYKLGQPKPDDRDQVQLCAQAICLEEMLGVSIDTGALFYGRTRRRQQVNFDAVLRERVFTLATEMHEFFQHGLTPSAEYSSACKSCSLIEICLPAPKAKKSIRRYFAEALKE
ncbi:MAG TPA: CRISPR-associated protein Cas4 [Firmicutes bacterium]|nr:CRISPR-associated protein Cas4 [Bacillota bacterium]